MFKFLFTLWRWCFFSNKFLVICPSSDGSAILVNKLKCAPSIQGYYMLEVNLSEEISVFRLELVNHDSLGEASVWELPIRGNGSFKRICYFDNPVESFGINFKEHDTVIKGLTVSFTKLSDSFALKRIEKKLKNKLGKRSALKSLSNNSKYSIYDQLFSQGDLHIDYQTWITSSESVIWEESINTKGGESPFFSVIIPTYNSKPEWLDACFQSVLDQTYSNWEIVVVDDASTDIDTLNSLRKWQYRKDFHINIIFREVNGHICKASNTGIEFAKGDYVCFLDHDDMLAPQALNELAFVIQNKPQVKLLYSDEDLMSESGKRMRPHFKPDWNPELLLNHNYVTHLCCYEVDLIRELDGMRDGLDGAQDYDLILRASQKIAQHQIHHIPKILYHWRMVEGSTAMSSDAKSYATEAGLKALKEHMESINPDAIVEYGNNENFYKVRWPMTISEGEKPPKVSIIIPTRDGLDVLKPCIHGLLNKTDYSNFEIVILDNGSIESETLLYLADLSENRLIKVVRDDGEFNYSRINNNAVSYSEGELVCLLNNDIEVIHSDWLDNMVSLAIRPDIGCVGAKLLYPDDSIQHAGVILGLGGYAAHAFRGLDRNYPGRAQVSQNLSAVTAACLVVKRSVYDAVGGLDEDFQVAYNDVDFCLRVKAAGFENVYTPDAELYHHESKTRGSDSTPENSKRFEREKLLLLERWSEVIECDPAYNPNLTRSREDFSVGIMHAQ